MSVLIETSFGDLTIDLLTDKAPLASKNFLKLCKLKYYNGALFWDVQRDYLTRIMHENKPSTSLNQEMYGDQAKYFEDQIDPERKHNRYGTVSTANVGPHMNNSNKFFITLSHDNIETLNGKHTIFGYVVEGQEILAKINQVIVDQKNRPYTNVRILHTLVIDDPFDDPPSLTYPDMSPNPIMVHITELSNGKDSDRLDVDDNIQIIDAKGRTEEEIKEATEEHQAKTKAIVLEMLNDLPDADIKPPDNVLFVCKLNPVTEGSDLETIFSQFGAIKSCDVIRDWKTGASLQYAFIEFETTAACEEAYFKMENALIDERRIHVDFSQSVAKYWFKYKKGGQGVPLEKDDGKGPKKKDNIPRGPGLQLKDKHRSTNTSGFSVVIEEDHVPQRNVRRDDNQRRDNNPRRDDYQKKEQPRQDAGRKEIDRKPEKRSTSRGKKDQKPAKQSRRNETESRSRSKGKRDNRKDDRKRDEKKRDPSPKSRKRHDSEDSRQKNKKKRRSSSSSSSRSSSRGKRRSDKDKNRDKDKKSQKSKKRSDSSSSSESRSRKHKKGKKRSSSSSRSSSSD